jgi:hypothetical protein
VLVFFPFIILGQPITYSVVLEIKADAANYTSVFLRQRRENLPRLLSRVVYSLLSASAHELTCLITAISPFHSPSSNADEQLNTLTRTWMPDDTARPTFSLSVADAFAFTARDNSHHQLLDLRVAHRARGLVCRRNVQNVPRSIHC